LENFNLTYSPYVNKKYEEFYKRNGYIPEMFNPYHCVEITDVCPTLTAQGDSITKSSTVLIIESEITKAK
jgi:vacuolar-type H+-ATPase catalytic subunit A/Vma1